MPVTIFDSKMLFDKQSLFWDEKIIGGTPISVHSVNTASIDMTIGTGLGDKIIRQTKRRFNYRTGKSQIINMTYNLGIPKLQVRKRVGLFDDNNGIFLEHDQNVVSFIVRSKASGSVVDTKINQSNWTGTIIDFSKVQLMIIDFAWLGIGRVRCGFMIEGQIQYVCSFNFSNVISTVFMSNPNLPLRYEFENLGISESSTIIQQICSSIATEGGERNSNIRRVCDAASTGQIGQTLTPILSIRLKSLQIGKTVSICDASILNETNKNFYWGISLNPIITGGASASWNSVPESAIEYDFSRNGSITDEGIKIASGYVSDDIQLVPFEPNSDIVLGSTIDGIIDEVVLYAKLISATGSNKFYTSLSWNELL